MKKITFLTICLIFGNLLFAQNCGFDQLREQQLANENFALQEQESEARLQNYINSNAFNRSSTILTVPVVIHVLHLGESVGTGSNISDAQIQSSIDNLNDFYRGQTANSPLDFEIQFELAKRDPSCNATTGINRINASGVTSYSANGVALQTANGADQNTLKDLSKWPETDYFNIWIVTEIDNNNGGFGIQGYANFYNGNAYEGSVMMATVFGYDPGNTNGWGLNSNGDNSTVVHEAGHYFHLYHTFQGDADNTVCPGDATVGTDSDGCADTVPHKRETSTCPANNSCTGNAWVDNNTINNIMSYYSCSDRMTSDQKVRVRAAMEGTSLVSSKGATAPDPSYTSPSTVCNTNSVTTTNAGIRAVTMNGKSFTSFSSSSDGGNIDESANCSNFFEIDIDAANTLDVLMYAVNWQQLGVWIDWNDDGDFDDDAEQQYLANDLAENTTTSVSLSYPATKPYGDYVRIRLVTDLDDIYGVPLIASPCTTSLQYGQSEDYTIYIKPTLSTNDVVLDALKVYVDRNNEDIVINGVINSLTKSYLYDINGREISNGVLNTESTINRIDASALSSGIYILQVDNGTSVKTQKLVIN